MVEVSNNCKNKASELRNERVRLIRNKIREVTGQEVNDWDKTTSFDLRGSQYIRYYYLSIHPLTLIFFPCKKSRDTNVHCS